MTASTQTGGQRTRATAAAEVTPAARGAGVIATVVTVAMRGVRKYMRTPQLLVFNIIGWGPSGSCSATSSAAPYIWGRCSTSTSWYPGSC
jgi:hypothetical protein